MLYLVFLILEVFIFTFIERKLWGTYITPLNALSIPTSIVIIIAVLYPYVSSTFYHFYFPVITVWIIGFALFFFISCVVSRSIKKQFSPSSIINNKIRFSYYRYPYKETCFYNILCILGSILLAYAFFKMSSVRGISWGSDEFSESFNNGGLIGHVIVFICAILGYMIYMADRKHKYTIYFIIAAIIVLYGQGVKSWIFVPVLLGLTSRIFSEKTKLNLKVALYFIITSFLIFILSYIIIMVLAGKTEFNEDFIIFLFDHFMFYLIGGPLSLSIDYQNGILEPYMFEELLSPIINLYNLFSGDGYLNPINPIYLNIGHSGNNVRTAVGTIFVYSQDWLIFIIFILLMSLIIYLIYAEALYSNNIFLKLASNCNLALLGLGFFEFYWLNLSAYEIVTIYLILSFFFKYFPSHRTTSQRIKIFNQ